MHPKDKTNFLYLQTSILHYVICLQIKAYYLWKRC